MWIGSRPKKFGDDHRIDRGERDASGERRVSKCVGCIYLGAGNDQESNKIQSLIASCEMK